MSTATSVIDRLRARIGVDGPAVTATVEAGHVRRFAEAIGDPNPRWQREAPPTFLVALAPAAYHIAEAEEYGRGWLNGGNRFEYFVPVMIGDQITARGRGRRGEAVHQVGAVEPVERVASHRLSPAAARARARR